MSDPSREPGRSDDDAQLTAAHGTAQPVDVSADRATRRLWALFVGGPIVWFTHFMVVYLVAEAGCTGDGPGLRMFDPPVPTVVTVVATIVAAIACTAIALWGLRWWRRARVEADRTGVSDRRHTQTLVFAGVVLAVFSVAAVVYTALPAFALWSC